MTSLSLVPRSEAKSTTATEESRKTKSQTVDVDPEKLSVLTSLGLVHRSEASSSDGSEMVGLYSSSCSAFCIFSSSSFLLKASVLIGKFLLGKLTAELTGVSESIDVIELVAWCMAGASPSSLLEGTPGIGNPFWPD